MSKKILSAVLAIAMMLSMCTGLMTSAAPDYQADRDALQAAISELYLKGPSISDYAQDYVVEQSGIVSWQTVKARNQVFACYFHGDVDNEPASIDNAGKADGNDPSYFIRPNTTIPAAYAGYAQYSYGNGDSRGTIGGAQMSELSKVTEGILLYAASAWMYGATPDMEGVDPEFNAARNSVVKNATAVVKGFLSFLRSEVGAYALNNITADDENKPVKYAEIVWAWRQQYAYKYNANYGVNPFEELDETLFNEWWTILVGNNLVAALAFPGWYTFEEMRANAEVAPLLNSFERLYRAAQTVKLNGVLYYEFMTGTKVELENAWKALVNALLAKYTFNKPEGVSAVEAVKAVHTLIEVIEFYDLYISDAYQNIYTSVDKELLSNVAFAKMLIEWISNNSSPISIAYFMGADYFVEFTNKIIAGIAALDPSTSNLALSDAEIDAGVALINQAQVLLDAWKFWGNKSVDTVERQVYDDLAYGIAALKAMLPYDAASKATYIIKEGTTELVAYDFDGTKLVKKNNAAYIEFAPNFFAYVRFVDILNAAYSAFNSQVRVWNANLETLDPVGITNTYNNQKLFAVLRDYDHLAGCWTTFTGSGERIWYTNDCDAVDDAKFLQILRGLIWPVIAGNDRDTSNGVDDDYAYDQMETFAAMYREAAAGYHKWNYGFYASSKYFNDVSFAGNSWNWQTGKIEGLKNGYDVVADRLLSMVSYLTVDGAELANIYRYVTLAMWNHFAPNENGALHQHPEAFVGGNSAQKGSLRYNFEQTLLPLFDAVGNEGKNKNLAELTKMYNRFMAATRALLTEDRGQPLLDQFLADIQSWVVTNKVSMDNNPWALYEKLCAVFGDPNAGTPSILLLPKDAAESYLYYNLTLKVVLNDKSPANKYAWKDQFVSEIYNKIAAASKALESVNVSNYDTEWVEKYNEVRNQCGYFLKMINLDAADGFAAVNNSDIPLWAVLNLYNQILEVNGEKGDHTVSALELYKTTALDPVLSAAYGKNINDYATDNAAGNKIWLAYTQAYANALTVRNDTRAPKSEVDAAAEALANAIDALADIAKAEPSATVADINNKIAEAEALIARADVEAASVDALEAAIKEAKAFVNDLKYVTTYVNADIDAAIADLQAAIDAVNDEVYFADDLAAYLSFVGQSAKVNADNYTAESYKAFVLAYNEAKAVAETTTNASAYLAAKALVEAAYNALEEPEMSKTLVAAVAKLAELKAVDTKDYSAESVAAYNAAVAALEAAIEVAAEDDVLLDLIAKAYLAKANLAIANPITLDD